MADEANTKPSFWKHSQGFMGGLLILVIAVKFGVMQFTSHHPISTPAADAKPSTVTVPFADVNLSRFSDGMYCSDAVNDPHPWERYIVSYRRAERELGQPQTGDIHKGFEIFKFICGQRPDALAEMVVFINVTKEHNLPVPN